VPDNKLQISALRLEDEPDADEKRKRMMKSMNAPALSQQKMKEEELLDELKAQFS
jgi:hypothetical protein